MTEVTLDREHSQTELPAKLLAAASILFMIIALTLSVSLLKWAVSDKLARVEISEGSQITVAVRERQLGCLAKNIYYEAASEPFEGKVAVAQVTMNRLADGKFGRDVCDVVYSKNVIYQKVICQFSWTCDGKSAVRPIASAHYREAEEVAKKVLLEGFRLPSMKDAMYYHADYVNPRWGKPQITKIGRHIFYRESI